MNRFGNVPWPLSVMGLLLFSFVNEIQYPVCAILFVLFSKNPISRFKFILFPVALAFFYTGIDWLLPKLFTDTLGHSLYASFPINQIADIGGPYLLTFLIVLNNICLEQSVHRIRKTSKSFLYHFQHYIPALLLLVLGLCYGTYRVKQINSYLSQSHPKIRIAAIQANIGDFDKLAAEDGVKEAANNVLNMYFDLSEHALNQDPKPDILVWPETAYPSTFGTPLSASSLLLDQKVESFVHKHDLPLIFGGYDRQDGKEFNSLFLLEPAKNPQIYHKNILLPFGEYIPGLENVQFIKDIFPQMGFFGRGPGAQVLNLTTKNNLSLSFSPAICYEALVSNYVLDAARLGSQLILNVTNDSWFGPFGEPKQHLAITVFRSIETRIHQLRSTNTGISALILPTGEITGSTPIMESAILNATIPLLQPQKTLMVSWGNWFQPFALIAGILLLFLCFKDAIKNSHNRHMSKL